MLKIEHTPRLPCDFTGDCRSASSVKLGGKFNAEDFDTIKRLKDALGSIDGFQFNYLDRIGCCCARATRAWSRRCRRW